MYRTTALFLQMHPLSEHYARRFGMEERQSCYRENTFLPSDTPIRQERDLHCVRRSLTLENERGSDNSQNCPYITIHMVVQHSVCNSCFSIHFWRGMLCIQRSADSVAIFTHVRRYTRSLSDLAAGSKWKLSCLHPLGTHLWWSTAKNSLAN